MPMVAKDGIGGQMSDSLMRQLGLETPDLGEVLPNGVPDSHFMWSCLDTMQNPFEAGGQGTLMRGFFGIHLSHEERLGLLDALRLAGIFEYGDYPYCYFSTIWYQPDLEAHATEIESLKRALGTEYKLRISSLRYGGYGVTMMVEIVGDVKPPIEPGRKLHLTLVATRQPGRLIEYANGIGDFDEKPFQFEVTGTLQVGFGKVDPLRYDPLSPLFAEESSV